MFENSLKERMRGIRHLLIIGVGNELGCDDAAGIELAKQMKGQLSRRGRVSIIEAGTTPENFTSIIRRIHPSHILIIDAAQMGLQPGSVRIVERNEITGFSFSTHALPLSFLVDHLKDSGAIIIVVGIEPLNIGYGKELSKPIMEGIANLAGILRQIISSIS